MSDRGPHLAVRRPRPTQEWLPKAKRPWNAALKTLCWKIGESFVKVSGNPGDFYGKLYAQRKLIEEQRNAAGAFAGQAAAKLKKFKIDKTTIAYQHYAAGKLPPAHIHARAKRWAVKPSGPTTMSHGSSPPARSLPNHT